MNRLFFFFLIAALFAGQTATAQPEPPALFPLSAVRLLESPFKKAQETDGRYVLSLDADRLLAPFLKEAGLTPLKESYGNWERGGLDGHIGGHYLTAVAQLYAATGNPVFKSRLDYFLTWLDSCQQKNADGYVAGIPEGRSLWTEVVNGNVAAVRKRWVPWYNIHKTFSGLADAYKITGDEKAKKILLKLSQWCWNLTSKLSDAQMEEMLQVEHGGMNEVLADVAVISGDQRYLALARRFSHKALLDPLLQHKDQLNGLHANTQIPKVVGFMQVASLAKDSQWADAARFFWNTVVEHRSIAIGGNSVREHFNPLNDFSSMLESREGPESCNSYNMLKLTRLLFLAQPSAKYLDYYERTLYNHILSSQHPNGGFVYFTPVRPNHYRVYSSPQLSFWCCVGSGIENHGKYGELIYAYSANDLYINLFIPSVLQWKQKGVALVQENNFPFQSRSRITVTTSKPQRWRMKIRVPAWLAAEPVISVNGKPAKTVRDNNNYLQIDRLWKNGDSVSISLPMKTYIESLPDKSAWVSFLHGPLVLAAATDTTGLTGLRADDSRWGHIANGKVMPMDEAPLLVIDDLGKASLSVHQPDSLLFTLGNLVHQEKYKNIKLVPFYQLHDQRYVMYFPYTSSQALPQWQQALKEKETARQQLDALTLDLVYPGEQQPEADHYFKGEQTNTGTFKEQHFRTGKGWFSYELRNPEGKARKLSFTYFGNEKDRSFDVYINNVLGATVTLEGTEGNRFVVKTVELPVSQQSSKTLTVLFKARDQQSIAAIYEVRLLQ